MINYKGHNVPSTIKEIIQDGVKFQGEGHNPAYPGVMNPFLFYQYDDDNYLKIPVTHEEIDRAAKLAGSSESDHLVETYVETVKNYIDAKIKEGE